MAIQIYFANAVNGVLKKQLLHQKQSSSVFAASP